MQTNDTSNDTATSTRYDHEAIAAALEAGNKPADIAAQHGCSVGLVQTLKRRMRNADLNEAEQRAAVLRKRADQLGRDRTLLAKWQVNDEAGGVTHQLDDALAAIQSALTDAADIYESIGEDLMRARKGSGGRGAVAFAAGQVVQVKEKRLDAYKGITASPQHLTIVTPRDRDVLVEDTDGARLFFPKKDLEPREDA